MIPPLERLTIEAECRRLVTRYCYYVDAYDHEALLALWAPDGVWTSRAGPMRGHAEIKAYLDAKPRGVSRHSCANHLVDVLDEGAATGSCYFTVFVGVPGADEKAEHRFRPVPLLGAYHDRYSKVGGEWRFASRSMERISTAG